MRRPTAMGRSGWCDPTRPGTRVSINKAASALSRLTSIPSRGVEVRVRPTLRAAVPINWKSVMYANIACCPDLETASTRFQSVRDAHPDSLFVQFLFRTKLGFHPYQTLVPVLFRCRPRSLGNSETNRRLLPLLAVIL